MIAACSPRGHSDFMATAEQLKALLRSYVDEDGDQFLTVSMQIAAQAARRGQGKLAQELGELKLPLLGVRLDGLITKFMGETASKLRLVFDAMIPTRGVYLFDEFDAIGGDRGRRNDVGEMRRVLNSFLQFLEADDSDSLIL